MNFEKIKKILKVNDIVLMCKIIASKMSYGNSVTNISCYRSPLIDIHFYVLFFFSFLPLFLAFFTFIPVLK